MNDNHTVMLRRIAESARSRVLDIRKRFADIEQKAPGTGIDAARLHTLFACEAAADIWWDSAGDLRTEYDVLRVAYTTRAVTREMRRLENERKRVRWLDCCGHFGGTCDVSGQCCCAQLKAALRALGGAQ